MDYLLSSSKLKDLTVILFSKSTNFSKYPSFLNFLKAKFSNEYSPLLSKPLCLNCLILAFNYLISCIVVEGSDSKLSI